MSALAQQTFLDRPLSLADIEARIARLPAQQRAEVKWTGPALRAALGRLQNEPLTNDLVLEVTCAVFPAFVRLHPILVPAIVQREDDGADIVGVVGADFERLRQLDPAAADAADWALGALRSMARLAASVSPEQQAEAVGSLQMDQFLEAEEAGLVRAQFLLMGLADLLDREQNPRRISELADLAYMEAARGVDAMARVGIRVDPFQGEPRDRRAARLSRYAQGVRDVLSEEDQRILDDARLHTLRS